MNKLAFKVGITPGEVLELVKKHQADKGAELVYEELHDLGDSKAIGTLVFQRYYFRASNKAALVVLTDNLKGTTEVRTVSTGSSQSLLFNFDWGAADDFANSTRDILREYLLE